MLITHELNEIIFEVILKLQIKSNYHFQISILNRIIYGSNILY